MARTISAETLWEFDSQEACSGATGIPLQVIRDAKQAGCEAFVYGRVKLGPLLRFLFSRSIDAEKVEWGEELKKWNAKRAETKAKREAGEVTPNDWIASAILKCGQSQTAILRQRLENEYPMIVAGLEVPQIRIKAKLVCDEVIKEFQQLESNWKQQEEQ